MNEQLELIEQEVWKTVPGFVGLEASSLGKVRLWNKIKAQSLTGKYYKVGRGYLATRVDGRLEKVHRLVALAFVPNPGGLLCVDHVNGRTTDNRPANLQWVTSRENQLRAIKTGLRTFASGEEVVTSKLTAPQVAAIRASYRPRGVYGPAKLAKDFGISITQIKRIIRGTAWKHTLQPS